MSEAYRDAGVDLEAGQKTVGLLASAVRSTYGPEVLAGVGSFGGLYDAQGLQAMQGPVLVASTDGVGTKVMLAKKADAYEGLGHDIVNHCVNDILVQGARPLFFLDYLATSKLEPEKLSRVVHGMAAACRENGCALLGGETAEMPGVYCPGEFDVAGTIVGVVERSAILPRKDLKKGDVLVGLASSGPHTNGYSLLRRLFPEDFPRELLEPHRSYLKLLTPHLQTVKALAHITGGGVLENLPRVLPAGMGVKLTPRPYDTFWQLVAATGNLQPEEMHRVFNCGVGMVAVLAPEDVDGFRHQLNEESWLLGELSPGEVRL